MSEKGIDFKTICDNMIDALYVTDKHGNTIYVNDAYLKLGDLSREEIIGKNIVILNDKKDLYSGGVLPDVLRSHKRVDRVGTLTRTEKKVHITGIPIFDENDNIIYAVATEKDIERLEELEDNLAEMRKANYNGTLELNYLRGKQLDYGDIVAESSCMQEALAIAKSVASTDVTVLITGESGTGKEIIADAIYMTGNRKGKPFIKLNCSAIPANLLESELFGYEEGSFTGASKGGKPGMDMDLRKALLAAETPEKFLEVLDNAESAKFNEEAKAEEPATEQKVKILAVTACPTGIAHTYMAAEALEQQAVKMGIFLKAETNGSSGAKNVLTKAEIAEADGIIIAADKNVAMARFDGKPVLSVKVADGINKPEELINKVIDGKAPVYHHAGAADTSSDEMEKESVGRKIYKDLMNGVSYMLPFVVGGGIMIALAFLIDTIAGAPRDGNFGTYTAAAAFFKTIGGYAFSFMICFRHSSRLCFVPVPTVIFV